MWFASVYVALHLYIKRERKCKNILLPSKKVLFMARYFANAHFGNHLDSVFYFRTSVRVKKENIPVNVGMNLNVIRELLPMDIYHPKD